MSALLDYTDSFKTKKPRRESTLSPKPQNVLGDISNQENSIKIYNDTDDTRYSASWWQNQTVQLTEECNKLRNQVGSLGRDKEREIENTLAAKKEQQYLANKISAMISEQRDLRNTWLSEKNDLESRLCQVQALNTQYQGTLKKKEKDYVKLQNQLEKAIKDSTRGQKIFMQISQPLKKNLTQDTSKPSSAVLKDAEVVALRNTITQLENDTKVYKQTKDMLQKSFIELQDKFDSAVKAELAKRETNNTEKTTIDNDKLKELNELIKKQDKLIHDALVGKLPGMNFTEKALKQVNDLEDTEDKCFTNNVLKSMNNNNNNSKSKRNLDELMNFKDSDLLPPASPATLKLLQSCGWTSLPNELIE